MGVNGGIFMWFDYYIDYLWTVKIEKRTKRERFIWEEKKNWSIQFEPLVILDFVSQFCPKSEGRRVGEWENHLQQLIKNSWVIKIGILYLGNVQGRIVSHSDSKFPPLSWGQLRIALSLVLVPMKLLIFHIIVFWLMHLIRISSLWGQKKKYVLRWRGWLAS